MTDHDRCRRSADGDDPPYSRAEMMAGRASPPPTAPPFGRVAVVVGLAILACSAAISIAGTTWLVLFIVHSFPK